MSEIQNPDLWKRLLELDQRVKEQFGDQWIGRFWKEYSLEEFSKWLEETNYGSAITLET